ncbi:hypothetical protein PULV_a0309 [Pseudoalteromonas ulvae UL12]|nr:hypothetical protein [Pseudoalteromonas ulvae UL12]
MYAQFDLNLPALTCATLAPNNFKCSLNKQKTRPEPRFYRR